MLESFERCMALIKLIIEVSKTIDMKAIRDKYHMNKSRIIKIHIADANRAFSFKFKDDSSLKLLLTNPTPDVEIFIATLCVFKHMRHGTIAGCDPATLQKVEIPYSPLDAWKFGDVHAYGDASTNDVLASVSILFDVMGSVDIKRVDEIIGPCDHDV